MLEKIVKKFKKPKITFGSQHLQQTHIVGRFIHFESSNFEINKKNNGSIKILKNRKSSWAGFYFEYGIRDSQIIQIIPVYFYRNNSSIAIGFGLYKTYFGFKYVSISVPKILKNRVVYYYGNLW